jgi:hypothetical protein
LVLPRLELGHDVRGRLIVAPPPHLLCRALFPRLPVRLTALAFPLLELASEHQQLTLWTLRALNPHRPERSPGYANHGRLRLCRPFFPINDLLALPMPESKKEKLINAIVTYENGIWRFRTYNDYDCICGSAL